jgi:hypothetical protein
MTTLDILQAEARFAQRKLKMKEEIAQKEKEDAIFVPQKRPHWIDYVIICLVVLSSIYILKYRFF